MNRLTLSCPHCGAVDWTGDAKHEIGRIFTEGRDSTPIRIRKEGETDFNGAVSKSIITCSKCGKDFAYKLETVIAVKTSPIDFD